MTTEHWFLIGGVAVLAYALFANRGGSIGSNAPAVYEELGAKARKLADGKIAEHHVNAMVEKMVGPIAGPAVPNGPAGTPASP